MALFPKQQEFLEAFKSQRFRFLLYGGAVGGGKSILQIGIEHQLAIDYPGTRWAIVRKNLSTLKKTSIPSYKKVLDLNDDVGASKFNYADFVARYKNGSEILFIDADVTKDPDLNKLKGLEVTGALIEEANEIVEPAFSILKTRVGRWKNNDHGIKPFIMLNCNPAKNWVKSTFYDPWVEDRIAEPYYYLPALPTDNPHLTPEYIEMLETLPEAEKQRYLYGNWEYSDDPNQLISYISIRDCFTEKTFEQLIRLDAMHRRVYLGVDVARYGDDRTVLCYFVGNTLCRFEEFKHRSTTEVARIVADRAQIYNIPHQQIAVDVVGLGAGTLDTLNDIGVYAIAFNAGESPDEKGPNPYAEYKNKRAEVHWNLRDDLLERRIEVINQPDFVKEATNISYEITEKVIQIESKESFKKRLQISPDYLDAANIANYARRMSSGAITSKIILGAQMETAR